VPTMSNVPSKLCACARAHKPWDQRTQEIWSAHKFSLQKCFCTLFHIRHSK